MAALTICLELLLSFLKIGAFTFGGGYGMIAIIREMVLAHGWMTETELLNFIAVAESTPGPIAVNMATFIGSDQAGFAGALSATFGVVLPSFVIILLIAAVMSNLLQYKVFQAFLSGIRPCIVALILATALTLGLSTLFSFNLQAGTLSPDAKGILLFAVLVFIHLGYQKRTGKKPSPILMILFSGIVGIMLY